MNIRKKVFTANIIWGLMIVVFFFCSCGNTANVSIPEEEQNKISSHYSGNGTEWGSDLFKYNSLKYNNEIALVAAELCEKAGSTEPEEIKKKYEYYGMKNAKDYNYVTGPAGIAFGGSAFVIGHDNLFIDGKSVTILVITARGSVSIAEFIGDWHNGEVLNRDRKDFLNTKVYEHVDTFYQSIINNLENDYLKLYPYIKQAENLKILVTGHSLGGAAANMLGAKFTHDRDRGEWWSGKVRKEDIYVYTFGAINVHVDNKNYEEGYENIHNIYNYYDSFGPNGAKATLGASSPFSKFGHTEIFKDERLHHSEVLKPDNHLIETYKEAVQLQSHEDILYLACEGNEYVEKSAWEEFAMDFEIETQEASDFFLEGEWYVYSDTGFGNAQPGALVYFDEEGYCDLFSDADYYDYYYDGSGWVLECTNSNTGETEYIWIEIGDDIDIITLYRGNDYATLIWSDYLYEEDGANAESLEFDGKTIPPGTYWSTDGFGQSFTFYGDNQIEMNAFGFKGKGTYEINGDTIRITYVLDFLETINFGDASVWTQPFRWDNGDIFISNVKFLKE